MFYIYPHDEHSVGAGLLKTALKGRRILHRNSKFVGSKDKQVINWGASTMEPTILESKVFNLPHSVRVNADKKSFFELMLSNKNAGRTPEWTTSKDKVAEWLSERKLVVARTLTRSKSGNGIVFFDDLQKFVAAPLYTVYVKKKEEYRVHFAFGKTIDVQRKVLRKHDDEGNVIDPKKIDWRVRNFANGFVFIRSDIVVPNDVTIQAMKCAEVSKLDFGAVDVIWNEEQGKAYVLEINTAPGIEGTTVESYAAAFRALER